MSDPEKIVVSWEEYFELVRVLVRKVQASGFEVQQVICIAQGGSLVGDLVSRALVFPERVPMATLSVQSYPEGEQRAGELVFSRDLTTATPLITTGVLLLDDLTENGTTTERTLRWLEHWYRIPQEQMRTGVLWHKATSTFDPDFFAQLVEAGPDGKVPWIVQPQEQFGATV